jgi:cytochrome P450
VCDTELLKQVLLQHGDDSWTVFCEAVCITIWHVDVFSKRNLLNEKTLIGQLMGRNVALANGDEWRRFRKILNPGFHGQWDTNIFGKYANQVVSLWKETSSSHIDIHDWMQR